MVPFVNGEDYSRMHFLLPSDDMNRNYNAAILRVDSAQMLDTFAQLKAQTLRCLL